LVSASLQSARNIRQSLVVSGVQALSLLSGSNWLHGNPLAHSHLLGLRPKLIQAHCIGLYPYGAQRELTFLSHDFTDLALSLIFTYDTWRIARLRGLGMGLGVGIGFASESFEFLLIIVISSKCFSVCLSCHHCIFHIIHIM
jgi:hypothetical protein